MNLTQAEQRTLAIECGVEITNWKFPTYLGGDYTEFKFKNSGLDSYTAAVEAKRDEEVAELTRKFEEESAAHQFTVDTYRNFIEPNHKAELAALKQGLFDAQQAAHCEGVEAGKRIEAERSKQELQTLREQKAVGRFIWDKIGECYTSLTDIDIDDGSSILLYAAAPVPASEDAKRLEWIGNRLFGHSWNGVVDSGSRTQWSIWSGFRHITQTMQGATFREAIDAAMTAAAPKEQA